MNAIKEVYLDSEGNPIRPGDYISVGMSTGILDGDRKKSVGWPERVIMAGGRLWNYSYQEDIVLVQSDKPDWLRVEEGQLELRY